MLVSWQRAFIPLILTRAVMRSAQHLGAELKVLQMCKLTLEKRSGIADTDRLKLEA